MSKYFRLLYKLLLGLGKKENIEFNFYTIVFMAVMLSISFIGIVTLLIYLAL